MALLYILIGIILVISLVLFIPLKIKFKLSLKTHEENKNEDMNFDNYIKIYLFGIIRIKKIKINQKGKVEKENTTNVDKPKKAIDDVLYATDKFVTYEKKNKLFLKPKDFIKIKNSMTFKKFYLNIGINLQEVITNAYVIAFLNALINIYIAKNQSLFDLKNTKYNTYISNKIFNIDFNGIINLKLVHTITVLIKLFINLRKVAKKDGKRTSN